jgi:hypothetical protein
LIWCHQRSVGNCLTQRFELTLQTKKKHMIRTRYIYIAFFIQRRVYYTYALNIEKKRKEKEIWDN